MSLLLMGMSGTSSILAQNAEAYWLASQRSGEYLPDLTGNGHDMRMGSVGSARVINKGRAKYLHLNGVAGNYASAPDSAALSITGDLTIDVKVAMNDWTPAAEKVIISKYGASAAARSYVLNLLASGELRFYYSVDGTNVLAKTSTVAPTVVDGATLWVRVSVDVDNGASGFDTKFYTSSNGTTWTQLGTTVTTAGVISIFDSAVPLEIGTHSGGTTGAFSGRVYNAKVYNSYLQAGSGTPVFNADFTNLADGTTSFTESSSNAATVTINSTSGADTNDPTYLEYTGTKYAYLPGIAGNNVTTPSHNDLDITGDIELRIALAMDAFPGSTQHILSKGNSGSAGAGSYLFLITGGGSLQLTIIPSSGIGVTGTSTVAVPLADIQAGTELRATWRASDGLTQFFTRPLAGGSFIQLGADRTISVADIFVSNLALGAGTRSAGDSAIACKIYSAQVRNGINGTIVANFDATTATSPYATTTDSTGKIWTFNRAATGKKLAIVDRTMLLLGTDDYLEVQNQDNLNFGAADNITSIVVYRGYGTTAGASALIAKRAGFSNVAGWGISRETLSRNYGYAGDGTTNAFDQAVPDETSGVLNAMAMTVDATNLTAYRDGSGSGSPIARPANTMTNTEVVRIGRLSGAGTGYLDGEIIGMAIFRKALTPAQLTQVKTELGG